MTYTFVTELDNSVPNQVLIGSSATDCARNLCDAIYANPDTAGIRFSLPTLENPAISPVFLGGATFNLVAKVPGSGGNSIGLSENSSVFSWSGGTLTSGTDPTSETDLTYGVAGSGTQQVGYIEGSTQVVTQSAIAGGVIVFFCYYRLGADFLSVEDSQIVSDRATTESSTGKYQQATSDAQNTNLGSALATAQRTLAAFKSMPQSFSFQTDSVGILPGQLFQVAVTDPIGASTVLDGQWVVQEVSASLVPGFSHFRYTVKMINMSQIASWVNFWENLATATNRVA